MRLLIDPDLDLDAPGREGLKALAERHHTDPVAWGYYGADDSGPRCDRCQELLYAHVWQLLDDDDKIFDCEAGR